MADNGLSIQTRRSTASTGTSLSEGLAGRKAQIRAVMDRSRGELAKSVAAGRNGASLSDRTCGNASPKVAAILQKSCIPAEVVKSDAHVFVECNTPEGKLIVDPTIRQFFGMKNAPDRVPEVFVGTEEDLKTLFEGNTPTFEQVYRVGHRPQTERDDDVTAETGKLLQRLGLDGSSCFTR